MVHHMHHSDTFSEGPAPLDLAEIANVGSGGAFDAPAPAPLGGEVVSSDTSAPPSPMMGGGELSGATSLAPGPNPAMDGMASGAAVGATAPAPVDIDGAHSADLGGGPPMPNDAMAGSGQVQTTASGAAPPHPTMGLGDTISQAAATGGGAPGPMSMSDLGRLGKHG